MTDKEKETDAGQAPDKPGSLLATARKRLGLSQSAVADQLRLPLTTIQQIEEGQLQALGSQVYARGHLRTYAKLVGVPPDKALAQHADAIGKMADRAFPKPAPKKRVLPAAVGLVTGAAKATGAAAQGAVKGAAQLAGPIAKPLAGPGAGLIGWIGGGLALAVGTGTLVWWLALPGEAPAVAGQAEAPAQEAAVSGGGETQPGAAMEQAANPQEASAAAPGNPLQENGPLGETGSLVAQDPLGQPAPPGTSETAALDGGPGDGLYEIHRGYFGGDDQLEFLFLAECQLEVSDSSRQIWNKFHKRLERAIIQGTAPFVIGLSRAGAAEVTFNGQPVDLRAYPASDPVSDLVLGGN